MAAAPEQLELDAARSRTEALYRQHGAAVFRICRAVLRDRDDAEDAAQQVFLSAHRALLGGAVPREPLAWLATIARRECWSRSNKANGAATEPSSAAAAPDASAQALRNADVAELWTAISELPRAQREALLLREIRGLSYDQLGQELSLSPPATRSLLSRARRSLRSRLRDLNAGLGGATWIDTLARLLSGGGSPAAPAARAAALGLGAAAIAGGAAITPTVLEHHVRRPVAVAIVGRPHHAAVRSRHHVPRPHAVRAVVVRVPVVHAKAVATPPRVERPVRVEHRGPVRVRPREDRRGPSVTSHDVGSVGDDGPVVAATTPVVPTPESGSTSSGEGETTPVETTTTTQPTITTQTSGHDGGGGGESSHDGGSSDGHGGGSDQSGESGGSDGRH